MDRFDVFKKICAASDRGDYEDVRVLLEQLKDIVYKETANEDIIR